MGVVDLRSQHSVDGTAVGYRNCLGGGGRTGAKYRGKIISDTAGVPKRLRVGGDIDTNVVGTSEACWRSY